MKKLLPILLCLCLLAALLTACAKAPGQPAAAPAEPAPEETAPTETAPAAETAPAEQTPPPAPALTDAEQYYVGQWNLPVDSFSGDSLQLNVLPDGTYVMALDADLGLLNGSESYPVLYHYSGDWSVEESGDEGPGIITFELTETDDPQLQDWKCLGVFSFETLSRCNGKLLTLPLQRNNGDSILTEYFSGTDNVLWKTDDTPTGEDRRTNDSFYAVLWETRYGDKGEPEDFGFGKFVVYADDVELSEDLEISNDVPESVPYIISDEADDSVNILSGGPDGLLALGKSVYLVTTDDKGEIVSVQYIPTAKAPTDEEAMEVLEQYDEVRIMMED